MDQRTGDTERLTNIQFATGKEGTPARQIAAGDIGFVTKLDGVATGDTLTGDSQSMSLPAFEMPQPLFEASISPETSADLDKMGTALARLAEEDPSLQTYRNDETAETILAGLGESHVRISLERARRKFGVGLKADVPQCGLPRDDSQNRERARPAQAPVGRARSVRGCSHRVLAALARGSGFEFEDRVVGGRVPRQYIPAVEKGLNETIDRGLLAGYPVVDLKAALFDGQYHSVDSSDESFRIAARLAYEDGIPNAGPVILEPILKLEIT